MNGMKLGEIVRNLIGLDEATELKTPLLLNGHLRFLHPSTVDYINDISPAQYLSQVRSRIFD